MNVIEMLEFLGLIVDQNVTLRLLIQSLSKRLSSLCVKMYILTETVELSDSILF